MKNVMRRLSSRGTMWALAAFAALANVTRLGATTVYWDGAQSGTWTTVASGHTNWSSSADLSTDILRLPNAGDDVVFYTTGAGNLITMLGGNFTINSLTMLATATSAVSIGPGSPTGTLTINGGGITLNSGSGALTITAGMVLGASQTWLNNSASLLSVNGNIANGTSMLTMDGSGNTSLSGILGNGSGGLIKSGTGTLTLAAANTYTGTTTVNAGVLSIGKFVGTSSNLGPSSSPIVLGDSANAGTLSYTGTSASFTRGLTVNAGGGEFDVTNATVSGTLTQTNITTAGALTFGGAGSTLVYVAITGAGSLVKTGVGTLTLSSAANAFNGLTLKAGTLKIGASDVAGSGIIVLGDSTGSTPVALNTGGVVALNNDVIWNQDVSYSGSGGLTLGSNSNAIALTGNRRMTVASGIFLSIAGSISGAGFGITKLGSGSLSLSAPNSFTGTTVLSEGTLHVDDALSLGGNGAALSQAGGTTLVLQANEGVNGDYILTLTGSGIATIIADRTNYNATVSHTLGSLNIGSQTLALGQGIRVTGTASLAFGMTTLSGAPVFDTGTGSILTLGSLVGDVAFTKQGGGQLTLNAVSSRTGGNVTVTGGTLLLNDPAALGNNGVALSIGGGTLDLASDSPVNAHNITVNGDTTIVSDLKTAGTGITHTLGTLSVGASTLRLTPGSNVNGVAGLTFGAATLTGNATFNTASNAKLTLGSLSGTFNLTKSGSGQLVLPGDSLRTGSVTLTNGILILNSTSALGTAAVPLSMGGGTLDLATDASVAAYNVSLTGSGSLTILADRLTSGNGITHTLGTLSMGAQTLTVDDTPTVTGGTPTLAFGAVTLGGNATINTNAGASTILASVGGTAKNLSIGGDGNTTISGVLGTTTGALFKSGNGTLTLLGNNTYNGGTTISLGTVVVGHANALSPSGGSISNFATLAIAGGITFSRNVTWNAGSTLAGSGTYNPTAAFTVPNLSPGVSSTGVLTLLKGVAVTGVTTLDIDTPGTSDSAPGISDRTDVTGNLTLSGSILSLVSSGSGGAGAYRIFTFTGTQTGTPTITSNLSNVHYKFSSIAGTGAGQGVFVDVYRYATVNAITPNPLDLGRVHLGGSLGLATLSLANTVLNDGFSEQLSATFGVATGFAAGSGSITRLNAGSTDSSSMSVSLGSGAQNVGGTVSGTILVNVVTDGTLTSGAGTTSLGSQAIAITCFVYTGQGAWSINGGGNWNSFGNWASAGGVPGVDGPVLSASDTATFGTALTGGTATVALNTGTQLSGLTFDSAGSYTIAGSGSLTLVKAFGPVPISVTGTHTIAVPVAFGSDVQVTTVGSGSRLTMAGDLTGAGKMLTKLGAGTLVLGGNGSGLTGLTTVSNGTLLVNGTLGGAVTVASGATLGGTGSIAGVTTIQSGGVLNPNEVGTVGTINLAALTLDPGSRVQLDLDSSTLYDQVHVSGTLGNGTDTSLELNLTSGATPFHVNDTFQLFSTGLGSSFANVYLPSGYAWDTSNLTQAGSVKVLAVLPEPGPLVLGAIALVPAGLALWKRRKKVPAETPATH